MVTILTFFFSLNSSDNGWFIKKIRCSLHSFEFLFNHIICLSSKQVLVAGTGKDSRPTTGEVVTVKVKGQLEDGSHVQDEGEITFTLNDGDVIVGTYKTYHLMTL